MKEQLINFETAKLAKEKGLCHYFNTGTEYVNAFYSEDGVVFKETEFQQEDCVILDRYFRPTQSLLQKWLREEHKLEITLTYYSNQSVKNWGDMIKDNYYVCVTDERDIDNPKWSFDGYFNSYEEALEQGLQEALKLI